MMADLLAQLFDSKLRSARRTAKLRLKEAKKLLRRARGTISQQTAEEVRQAGDELRVALKEGKTSKIIKASDRLAGALDKHLDDFRKAPWRESMESIGVAVLVALFLRSFVVEAFKIPSGSMIPTLAVGDQIFVNKYIYGVRVPFTSIRVVDFSMPERGEVVVFRFPRPPHEDYIKRVVGLPGDKIEVVNNVLYVNDEPVPRKSLGRETFTDRTDERWFDFKADVFEETLDGHTYTVLHDSGSFGQNRNFGPTIVPEGKLFVMGDNRDHSFDSRSWGEVPLQNVLGRALFVWFSWGPDGFAQERLGTWIN